MKKQIQALNIYRFMAFIIITYYHLIMMPTYSSEIPCILENRVSQPLLEGNVLGEFAIVFFNLFRVDFGSLACTMFFLASGYLASKMMDRYSRKEYAVNRIFSIFPTLWVCIVIIVCVVSMQGIHFDMADILNSAFPFWYRNAGRFVSAVWWTFRVEIKFYMLVFLCGKNKKVLVLGGYALMLLLALASYEFNSSFCYYQMFDMQFVCFSLLGVVVEQVQKRKWKENGIFQIVSLVIANIFIFKISAIIFGDEASRNTYTNVLTQVIPLVLLIGLLVLEEKVPHFFENVPVLIRQSGKIFLPYYFIHTSLGISIMYWIRLWGGNIYIAMICGILFSVAIAIGVYFVVMRPSIKLSMRVIESIRKVK